MDTIQDSKRHFVRSGAFCFTTHVHYVVAFIIWRVTCIADNIIQMLFDIVQKHYVQ
ncbi:hypothetical protein SAMN05421788_1121 [Filimonas lacunae]|uniref:Uncharacterized protein n=1 Tax=Filimonas lacunae TaxID=477680 RepID=A0A1N7RD20_9BACT|nr:hypothetical protein SAMN05421788_1121 [Filimonas lacunae]